MQTMYAKVNGQSVSRPIPDDQVDGYLRRGWSLEKEEAPAPKKRKAKKK